MNVLFDIHENEGICPSCDQIGTKLCGRCRKVYYRDKKCQKQHYRKHVPNCPSNGT